MDPIDIQYRRIRQKYPDAPELDIWHGVAIDFYIRHGTIPTEVLVQSALARAEGYDYKYRPDQLRVPAGNPDGGQWTDEGGGGGASTRDRVARNKPPKDKKPIASDAPAQPVRATDSSPRMFDEVIDQEPSPFDGAEIIPAADRWGYNVDLEKEERGFPDSRRGHTIEKHVAQSERQIVDRIFSDMSVRGFQEYFPEVGTFRSVEEANLYVNEALRRQSSRVEAVIRGELGKDPVWIIQEIGPIVGKVGYYENGRVYFVDARWVAVSIQKANNKNGFRVITAFPKRPGAMR
jgi:hypothetical protein